MPLLAITVPANARLIVDAMIQVATFDLIESETIFGSILNFPEENDFLLREKFLESGYESYYMINLLGMSFLIIFMTFATMWLLLITNPFKTCFAPLKKQHDKVYGIIFWNFWLRYLIEDSLMITIALFCNLGGVIYDKNAEAMDISTD